MSELKFTKGKWTSLKPQDGNGFVYVNNEYLTTGIIATCYGDGEEPQANALLISKSPEMLKMLNKIAPTLARYGEMEQHKDVMQLIKEATELL
jgi:hypothetical protein